MTHIVLETGAGVREANAYTSVSFVDDYLADRQRTEENDWIGLSTDEKQSAIVKATDYIEHRWGQRFKGTREFSFDEVLAVANFTLTGVPSDGETATIRDQTYTFRTALTVPEVANEVLIGVDAAANASNLHDAIGARTDGLGTTFSSNTVSNRHATSELAAEVVNLTATANGEGGNSTGISETIVNATSSGSFSGGLDGGSQPLSFPQLDLFDRAGRAVLGVPLKLKQATAEYAVRAAAAELTTDPAVDEQGASIKLLREKVGPLETETEYVDGTHLGNTLKPYPAADRLLADYVRPTGVAVR